MPKKQIEPPKQLVCKHCKKPIEKGDECPNCWLENDRKKMGWTEYSLSKPKKQDVKK